MERITRPSIRLAQGGIKLASVVVNGSRGRRYVQVVDYYKERGYRKRKCLKSFGPETIESVMKAHQYKANCNALESLAKGQKEWEDFRETALLVFGSSLGKETIDYILNKMPS